MTTWRKSGYVLVDLYGGMNALTKPIAAKDVRTKDIRAFLEKDFPPEALPTVDEARALVAQHRRAQEDFLRSQRDHRRRALLKAAQAERRVQAMADRTALDAGQKIESFTLAETQRLQRLALKRSYGGEARRVRDARARARPTGLAAFLGRVTGVNLVICQVQRHRDTKRYEVFRAERAALVQRQDADTRAQTQRHILHAFDADRALRALDQVDTRELKSFETKQVRAERTKQRGESGKMPALALGLELKPRGRAAAAHKAVYRHRKRDLAKSEPPLERSAPERPAAKPEPAAKEDFMRAAAGRIAVDADRGDQRGGTRPQAHDDRRHHDDEPSDVPEQLGIKPRRCRPAHPLRTGPSCRLPTSSGRRRGSKRPRAAVTMIASDRRAGRDAASAGRAKAMIGTISSVSGDGLSGLHAVCIVRHGREGVGRWSGTKSSAPQDAYWQQTDANDYALWADGQKQAIVNPERNTGVILDAGDVPGHEFLVPDYVSVFTEAEERLHIARIDDVRNAEGAPDPEARLMVEGTAALDRQQRTPDPGAAG